MRIFLCRHGETTGDIEDRYGGDYDDQLTDTGIAQSEELANKLDGFGIKLIISSPRIRAKETAKIISKKLKVKTIISKNLRERNSYGILTGLVKSEAKIKFPLEVEKFKKSKLHPGITGTEEYEIFKKRVLAEFESIVSAKKQNIVCVVSHGGPISCFVREVLKLGEIKTLDNCAVLEIEIISGKYNLVAVDGIEFEDGPANKK